MSKDSLKAHEKFTRDQSIPFTLLSDPDLTMMTAYGAFGEKLLYGKTALGVTRSTVVVDPAGTVIKHWTKVAKADLHPAQVLEFLKKR